MNNENELSIYRKKVYFVRGLAVMLDKDLASFYDVDTRVFNQARKRKQGFFEIGSVFQLTQEEYQEILNLQGISNSKGHLPWVFTEKAAYKMAFVLDSKISMKVSDLIVDIFMEVREGNFVSKVQDNKTIVLEKRLSKLETDMKGVKIENHFHAPVTVVQGGTAQVNLGIKEDFLLQIIMLMQNNEVLRNDKLTSLLSKAIEQTNKKDKKGLLETLASVSDIGNNISSIGQALPILIESVNKLLF